MTKKRTEIDPIAPRLLALEKREKRYRAEILALKTQLAEAKLELELLKTEPCVRSYNPSSCM